jgi:hypothetical protein
MQYRERPLYVSLAFPESASEAQRFESMQRLSNPLHLSMTIPPLQY